MSIASQSPKHPVMEAWDRLPAFYRLHPAFTAVFKAIQETLPDSSPLDRPWPEVKDMMERLALIRDIAQGSTTANSLQNIAKIAQGSTTANSLQNIAKIAQGETVTPNGAMQPGEWQEAQEMEDNEQVGDAFRSFVQDSTGDNATHVVLAVIREMKRQGYARQTVTERTHAIGNMSMTEKFGPAGTRETHQESPQVADMTASAWDQWLNTAARAFNTLRKAMIEDMRNVPAKTPDALRAWEKVHTQMAAALNLGSAFLTSYPYHRPQPVACVASDAQGALAVEWSSSTPRLADGTVLFILPRGERQ